MKAALAALPPVSLHPHTAAPTLQAKSFLDCKPLYSLSALASPWPCFLPSLYSPTYLSPSADVHVPAPARQSTQHPHALPAHSHLHALGIRPLACRCMCVCRLTHSKPIHACETVPSLEEATWPRGTPKQPHAIMHHKFASMHLTCSTPIHSHSTGTKCPGEVQAISLQQSS